MAGSRELFRMLEWQEGLPLTVALIRSRVHPQDRPRLEQLFSAACDRGTDVDCEHRRLMPDRAIKYVRTVAKGIRARRGRLEYIGAVQDMTRWRTAEQG